MTIDLIVVGKTDSQEVTSLVELYLRRINRYVKFSVITIPDQKKAAGSSLPELKKKEGEMIMKQLSEGDQVVLLDEKGRLSSSVELAAWLGKRMASGVKRLVFVIGGAYGFSTALYDRADELISLSPMTFSHQIVRAIFTEQLYRGFAIINNEPYHHQ